MPNAIDTLNQHVSIRYYTDDPINNATLSELFNAARRSPTSSNMQAYSLIVIRDQITKDALAEYAGNQAHVRECPVFIAICADISRMLLACEQHDKTLHRNLENFLVASVDAALVGMSLSTAAESVGLGTVMIGGLRNHPYDVAKLLNLPEGAYAVFGLCLGYPDPDHIAHQKPRFAPEAIIHHEQYDPTQHLSYIKDYDQALATHYRQEGRQTPDHAWSGIMAHKYTRPMRQNLKEELEILGWVFE
ncbi:nitroreductase family protein [Anaerolineales bacterium]